MLAPVLPLLLLGMPAVLPPLGTLSLVQQQCSSRAAVQAAAATKPRCRRKQQRVARLVVTRRQLARLVQAVQLR